MVLRITVAIVSLCALSAVEAQDSRLDDVIKRLQAEYDEQVVARLTGQTDVFVPRDNQARRIFVIIDHYDDVEPLNKGLGLAGLSQVGKGRNMHLVIGGTLGIMRSGGDELRRRAESARYTLVLQDYEAVRYMGAKGNFSITKELPPGATGGHPR